MTALGCASGAYTFQVVGVDKSCINLGGR